MQILNLKQHKMKIYQKLEDNVYNYLIINWQVWHFKNSQLLFWRSKWSFFRLTFKYKYKLIMSIILWQLFLHLSSFKKRTTVIFLLPQSFIICISAFNIDFKIHNTFINFYIIIYMFIYVWLSNQQIFIFWFSDIRKWWRHANLVKRHNKNKFKFCEIFKKF